MAPVGDGYALRLSNGMKFLPLKDCSSEDGERQEGLHAGVDLLSGAATAPGFADAAYGHFAATWPI